MELAPIILFTYNRLFHTEETIKALQKNELANKSDLFIFSDGPKNNEHKEEVNKVRNYLKTIEGFKSITIFNQEENKGLANSIIEGVTQIINQYGKTIVLEDDLVTSPYFLRYMNKALEFYENENKIFHVGSYMLPINTEGLESTFFTKLMFCWGWGTWKRAWNHFKKDTNYYINTFSKKMIKDFNLGNQINYFKQILDNKRGKIDTWAIYWYASIFLNKGLSVNPTKSLVKNIGHDGTGVHCGRTTAYETTLEEDYKIQFNHEIFENSEILNRIKKYHRKYHSKYFKITNKVRNLLGVK